MKNLNQTTNKDFLLQIKKIREQILLSSNKHPIKSIIITSAGKGHGASTITNHLAYSLSNMNDSQKILICADRDINNQGDSKYEAVAENIFLTKIPWDKIEQEELDDLEKQFSYILFDAPLVTMAPETLGLVPKVDLVLLVVESNKIKWQAVKRVKEALQDADPRNLGVILNKKEYYIPKLLYRWL